MANQTNRCHPRQLTEAEILEELFRSSDSKDDLDELLGPEPPLVPEPLVIEDPNNNEENIEENEIESGAAADVDDADAAKANGNSDDEDLAPPRRKRSNVTNRKVNSLQAALEENNYENINVPTERVTYTAQLRRATSQDPG